MYDEAVIDMVFQLTDPTQEELGYIGTLPLYPPCQIIRVSTHAPIHIGTVIAGNYRSLISTLVPIHCGTSLIGPYILPTMSFQLSLLSILGRKIGILFAERPVSTLVLSILRRERTMTSIQKFTISTLVPIWTMR